jgi:hypothetical protein
MFYSLIAVGFTSTLRLAQGIAAQQPANGNGQRRCHQFSTSSEQYLLPFISTHFNRFLIILFSRLL